MHDVHVNDDERSTTSPTGRERDSMRSLCGPANKVSDSRTAKGDTLWFYLSAVKQTQREKRWWTCSCCCVEFGVSTVTEDEGSWAQSTTGCENKLSFTPQQARTIQTRTVLSKKVLVLENVVFDVSCIKQTHLTTDTWTKRRGRTDRVGAACLFGTG